MYDAAACADIVIVEELLKHKDIDASRGLRGQTPLQAVEYDLKFPEPVRLHISTNLFILLFFSIPQSRCVFGEGGSPNSSFSFFGL